MKTYIVIADAWIYGKHYKAGQSIRLNEKQAKYELLSGTLTEHVAVGQPAPAPAPEEGE